MGASWHHHRKAGFIRRSNSHSHLPNDARCFPLASSGGEGWGEEALAHDYRPAISSSSLQPISLAGRAQRPPLPDPLLLWRRGKPRRGRRTARTADSSVIALEQHWCDKAYSRAWCRHPGAKHCPIRNHRGWAVRSDTDGTPHFRGCNPRRSVDTPGQIQTLPQS